MERDPAALREQTTQPLLGAEAHVEYYDAKLDWVTERFYLRKTAEAVYPYAQKAFRFMDKLGGKFAHGLGLTSSRFQYALDEYNRRERKMYEKMERENAKEKAIKHQQGLVDEDDSRMPYVPPVSLIFLSSSGNNNNSANTSSASSSASSTSAAPAHKQKKEEDEQKKKVAEALESIKKPQPAQQRHSASSSSSVKPSASASKGNDDDDDEEAMKHL